jgi:type II secretion system protein I
MKSLSTLRSAALHSGGFSLLEVMIALAILGIAVVAVFQLFSINLRTTKRAEDYTKAIFYARSLMDEAQSFTDPSADSASKEYEERYTAKRDITLRSESEDGRVKVFEVAVSVSWPPSGSFSMRGLKTVYDSDE